MRVTRFMLGDQTPDGEIQETLLFAIRDRIERGVPPVLRASEAVELLDWALSCEDPERQRIVLGLFRQLGGMRLVRAALSDFD